MFALLFFSTIQKQPKKGATLYTGQRKSTSTSSHTSFTVVKFNLKTRPDRGNIATGILPEALVTIN